MQKHRIALLDYDRTLADDDSFVTLGSMLEKEGLIQKGFTKDFMNLAKDYMNGKINYNEALALFTPVTLSYFSGLDYLELVGFIRDKLNPASRHFSYAKELIELLHQNGFIVIVVTGTLDLIIEAVQDELNIDSYYASSFKTHEGKILDKFALFVDNNAKELFAKQIVSDAQFSLSIGDSQGDFEMLDLTDKGILLGADEQTRNLAKDSKFTISERSEIIDIVNQSITAL